jgi:hypothetical protein
MGWRTLGERTSFMFRPRCSFQMPRALKRLVEEKVPATAMHQTQDSRGESVLVMETVSSSTPTPRAQAV